MFLLLLLVLVLLFACLILFINSFGFSFILFISLFPPHFLCLSCLLLFFLLSVSLVSSFLSFSLPPPPFFSLSLCLYLSLSFSFTLSLSITFSHLLNLSSLVLSMLWDCSFSNNNLSLISDYNWFLHYCFAT